MKTVTDRCRPCVISEAAAAAVEAVVKLGKAVLVIGSASALASSFSLCLSAAWPTNANKKERIALREANAATQIRAA